MRRWRRNKARNTPSRQRAVSLLFAHEARANNKEQTIVVLGVTHSRSSDHVTQRLRRNLHRCRLVPHCSDLHRRSYRLREPLIMATVLDLLKGKPVLTMRRGCYPNKADIIDLMSRFPNHVICTETMHVPHTTFVVTAQVRH